ncbi:hypothetical protein Tco_0419167 [Tanacetum coccineum]
MVATIGYSREIGAKGTLKKSCLPPRFISLLLEYMMHEYDNEELTINPTQRFPRQKGLELKVDSEENNLQNTHLSPRLRHPNPKLANQKKKISHVQPRKKAQATPSTPVVGEMHKEAQQEAGDPTSLGATSKEGAHPQLSSGHNDSADSTVKLDPGIICSYDLYLKQWKMMTGKTKGKYEAELPTLKARALISRHPTSLLIYWFATVVENASGATTKDVPSAS